MVEYEYYDWSSLIGSESRLRLIKDIDDIIDRGDYWKNSPPYQTNINIFGLQNEDWINLKMSFIWSCFAYMKTERQIKGVKSWAYKTNIQTQENRDNYWHQHLREGNLVLSGVYYLHVPLESNQKTSGTEFAPDGVEKGNYQFAECRTGNWIIFPGKTWHRPGILTTQEYRYIVAADMEL
jgi:hypothetical protein